MNAIPNLRRPPAGRVLAAGLTLALLIPAAVWAQAEQPGIFGEVIDVRVINVEVVVTDKDGVRVRGLTPDDFELTVDGQAVPIEYFTEVVGGQSVAPAQAGSTVPALAPGAAVGTSYLVFIDEYFAITRDRNRVMRRMMDQLPLLNPEDRMAVVAFDGKSIDMLSSWSQSQEDLHRVFQKAMGRPANGLQRVAERRAFAATQGLTRTASRDPVESFGGPVAGLNQTLDIQEEAEAERITAQARKVVLAGAAALRGFANPPGRKVMVLLSGGWPYNPAQWVVNDPRRGIYATSLDSGDDIYQPLIETANRLSYTLYPVDLPGLGTEVASVESLTAPALLSTAPGATGVAIDPTVTFDRELEEEQTLRQLAIETGGRAMINSASYAVLERVVEDTRSYYWLGFTPLWQGSDETHDVRVRPKRRGLEVRTRRSYADLSRQREVSMMVESSLLFGNAPSAESFPAALGTAKRAGFGKVEVPFRVAIPLHALTFLPVAEGWSAAAELRIAVLDEEGNTADIPVIPLELRSVGEPDGSERFSVYENRLKIRKRHHDLVFSLFEPATGKILSTRIEFDPES